MESKTVKANNKYFFCFYSKMWLKGSEKMNFKPSTSIFHYDEGKSVKRVLSLVSKDEKAEISHLASACDPEN